MNAVPYGKRDLAILVTAVGTPSSRKMGVSAYPTSVVPTLVTTPPVRASYTVREVGTDESSEDEDIVPVSADLYPAVPIAVPAVRVPSLAR
jgi:hypothetical protein